MAKGVRTLEPQDVPCYTINLFCGYLSLMKLQKPILSKITDKAQDFFIFG